MLEELEIAKRIDIRPLRVVVIGAGLVGGSAAQAMLLLNKLQVSIIEIDSGVRRSALDYGIESQLDLSNLDEMDLALLAIPPDQTVL